MKQPARLFLSLSLLPCTMLALTLLTNALINMESEHRAEGPFTPSTTGITLDRIHVLRGREWVEVGEGVSSQR